MKRIASFLLALLLIFSLCACEKDVQINAAFPETNPSSSTVDPSVAPSRPEQSVPDVTEPEDTEPEVSEPEVTEPEVTEPEVTEPSKPQTKPEPTLDPNGSYTTKEDVALYIHLYGKLPSNFMTKSQAKKLGWKSGALEPFAPGKCIGGDTFRNNEGLLPKKSGRTYKECDIDTLGGGPRGSKRIVFSNDGLVYYTSDHYRSFTLLYGTP